MVKYTFLSKKRPWTLFIGLLLVCAVVLTSCGGSATSSSSTDSVTTVTLAAPNQWNDSGTSFGPGWDAAIAQYQKLHTNVKIKIVVLPLSSFYQTLSTQLAASTAPDIVFNQATYKPYMVTRLDDYLNKPNPYAPERSKWIDWFNLSAYGFNNPQSVNADGHLYWVPLNLFDAGFYYNKDAFAKAGVTAPLKTWEDWRAARKKLKAAGYVPLAMDNSLLGTNWTSKFILNSLLAKYYDQWNSFDISGKPGKSDALTDKDIARAIKSGQLNGKLPEVAEALKLTREIFTEDATPNWSGIKGLSGAGVNLADFLAGKAAMAWGANFGAGDVQKASFQVGSMAGPTITTETTPLSTNFAAQFGVEPGGTSYMIPSTTKGDHLKWAVDFLQYMTAPKYSQPWITATTGVPSVDTVKAPDVIAAFSEGEWGKTERQSAKKLQELTPDLTTPFQQTLQAYLLGSRSLENTQDAFTAGWQKSAQQLIKDNNWQEEDWAK